MASVQFRIMVAATIITFWLLVIPLNIFPHIKPGFYCDDRSIQMHYNGELISARALLIAAPFVYPILWICETCFYVPDSVKYSRYVKSAQYAWKWFRDFLFAFVLMTFLIDSIKVMFSELRPHFLDTCRPDALKTCTNGQYVVDWKCTNEVDWFVRDASKSFPSGHAALTFFEAIFLIWYFQKRTPKPQSKLLILTIQVLFLLYACICSISRITDKRHHWWDVLAGAAIGSIFAVSTCLILCKNFQVKNITHDEIMLQNTDQRNITIYRAQLDQ